mmetsp:Transcript_112868/g.205131  ORF Transcript_112868/g.205131 Transcript_112868/m.205131 type:complete len:109 (-) Transcript_112868:55-381(-)
MSLLAPLSIIGIVLGIAVVAVLILIIGTAIYNSEWCAASRQRGDGGNERTPLVPRASGHPHLVSWELDPSGHGKDRVRVSAKVDASAERSGQSGFSSSDAAPKQSGSD